MGDIAKLTVGLYANSAQFVSELQKTQRKSKSWSKAVVGHYNTAKVAGAAMGVAVTGALTLMYNYQAQVIDQTAKFADRIGISTEALTQFRHGAELTGVGARSMDMALQRMTRRIQEAAGGSGEAAPALRQLGLDAATLGQMTPDQQLHALADAFTQVESQSERVRLAFKLFDSEGVAMVNMLSNGSQGLRAMADEADALGITLSRIDANKVEMANDAMFKVKQTSTAFQQHLTTELAPVVGGLADEFVELAKAHGGMSVFITDGIDSIATGVGYVANAYHGWQLIFAGISTAYLSLKLEIMSGMQGMSDGAYAVGNAITKGMIWPQLKALELLGEVSPLARQIKADLEDLVTLERPSIVDVQQVESDLAQASARWNELLTAPLPSDGIDQWMENTRARFNEAAELYASSVNYNAPGATGLPAGGSSGETEADRARQRLQDEMEQIRVGFLEKQDLEKEQRDQRQAVLAEWYRVELDAHRANEERQKEITLQYLDLSKKNRQKYDSAIDKMETAATQKRLNNAASMYGSLAGLSKAFAGEQSDIYRVMSAAQHSYTLYSTLLSSKEAIAKAWASAPFPANLWAVGMAAAETGALSAAVQSLTVPRYHTGGIAGMPSDNFGRDEVPAILERGEEIITERDPRHRNNLTQSAAGGRSMTVIVENHAEPVTARTEEDDEGRLKLILERADEYIAGGIATGNGETSFAIESILGGNRAASAV
ncbi:MAG: hypothetical protein OIF55_16920 [Amphritea sp.]|nr:hypothetical protein [Amphritea sp.]